MYKKLILNLQLLLRNGEVERKLFKVDFIDVKKNIFQVLENFQSGIMI